MLPAAEKKQPSDWPLPASAGRQFPARSQSWTTVRILPSLCPNRCHHKSGELPSCGKSPAYPADHHPTLSWTRHRKGYSPSRCHRTGYEDRWHRQSETKPPAGWRPTPALPFPALPQPVPLPLFAPEDYHGNSRLPGWCPGQWSARSKSETVLHSRFHLSAQSQCP